MNNKKKDSTVKWSFQEPGETTKGSTIKFVLLSTLLAHLRRKVRRSNNPMFRRQLSMASRTLDQMGDFAIHQEAEVRDEVAGSIAARLSLSPEFVIDRLNQLHRIAPYDDQG